MELTKEEAAALDAKLEDLRARGAVVYVDTIGSIGRVSAWHRPGKYESPTGAPPTCHVVELEGGNAAMILPETSITELEQKEISLLDQLRADVMRVVGNARNQAVVTKVEPYGGLLVLEVVMREASIAMRAARLNMLKDAPHPTPEGVFQ